MKLLEKIGLCKKAAKELLPEEQIVDLTFRQEADLFSLERLEETISYKRNLFLVSVGGCVLVALLVGWMTPKGQLKVVVLGVLVVGLCFLAYRVLLFIKNSKKELQALREILKNTIYSEIFRKNKERFEKRKELQNEFLSDVQKITYDRFSEEFDREVEGLRATYGISKQEACSLVAEMLYLEYLKDLTLEERNLDM